MDLTVESTCTNHSCPCAPHFCSCIALTLAACHLTTDGCGLKQFQTDQLSPKQLDVVGRAGVRPWQCAIQHCIHQRLRAQLSRAAQKLVRHCRQMANYGHVYIWRQLLLPGWGHVRAFRHWSTLVERYSIQRISHHRTQPLYVVPFQCLFAKGARI